jgi:hypothetical protein
MTHPCDGHVCDNCAICQAGYCCGSITTEQRAQLETSAPNDERLREAVEQERGGQPSIAELVLRDAAQQTPAALPTGPVLSLPAPKGVAEPTETRKEPVYVAPARTT